MTRELHNTFTIQSYLLIVGMLAHGVGFGRTVRLIIVSALISFALSVVFSLRKERVA